MTVTKPFVAVAGSIATGKSSLLDALGDALSVDTFPERWQENPWFGSPDRLSSQLRFLFSAALDAAEIAHNGGVQERCLQEHALVFAAEVLHGEDARLLEDAYSLLDRLLPSPGLLVYLHAPAAVLARRVRDRGRPQEGGLTVGFLTRLERRYADFLAGWSRCPIVRVDSEQIDLRTRAGVAQVLPLVRGAIA